MGNKRLLTMSDLHNYFFQQGQNFTFASGEDNQEIVVHAEGTLVFSQEDSNKEGLMPVTLLACHSGSNLNNSHISKETLAAALPSFKERPILGFIHKVNDEYEFYSHNMYQDEDGEIIYQEHPVGHIISEGSVQPDEESGEDFVRVNGYIYEEYSKAAEILRRKQKCNVSVELDIRKLSYDATTNMLEIEDFYFNGVTILGVDEDGKTVKPAMTGSYVTLADFSAENTFESPKAFNNKNSKEGGEKVVKFNELLEKYNKTEDDVTFEYADLTDEELEAKFEEVFGKTEDGEPTSQDEEHLAAKTEDEKKKKKAQCSIGEKTFSVDLGKLGYELSEVVNSTYSKDYSEYYSVRLFEGYVVMIPWDETGIAYKQEYVKNEGEPVKLIGERTQVYESYLTKEERDYLDGMQKEYPEMKDELQHFHDEPKKMEILCSSAYDGVREEKEFKNLVDDHFSLSIEEVSKAADKVIIDSVHAGKFSQAGTHATKDTFKSLPPKKVKRFGSMFDGII